MSETAREPRCAYGHFNAAGDEYLITRAETPTPWINVISNGHWGVALSNAGGGYCWHLDANLSRVTRWEQDLVGDQHGRWIYLTDSETGRSWSPTRQPAGREVEELVCAHGLGYSRFAGHQGGVACELTVTVPPDEAGEVWILRLRSLDDRPREVVLSTYLEWHLGPWPEGNREFHKVFIETEGQADGVQVNKRLWPLPGAAEAWNSDYAARPYLACSHPITAITDSREAFLGRYGDLACPRFVAGEAAELSGKWGDGICALRVPVRLTPGADEEVRFVLAADPLCRRHLRREGSALLAEVRQAWRAYLDPLRAQTPERDFDLLANTWLPYQAISCRIDGRAAYYQSSGAFGFRDQLQDSLLLLTAAPARARAQIVAHAGRQHRDGSVQHWWHPLTGTGPRSHFSDDLLWLPYVACRHAEELGQDALVDERTPYLDGGDDTIDGHCRRAIDRALSRRSQRGLPLIGEGDWNDGLSSCGDEGRGESVWMGHFLCRVLADYADLLQRRGEDAVAAGYRREREALVAAVNTHGWDGDWYWRASLDDGALIGSARCEEGRIFLNAQTWAVIGETAPAERRRQAMAAVRRHLDREFGPVLLYPAYSRPDARIGYITRYAPGLRENGGVYTHAACWAIIAAVMSGDPGWAYAIWQKLSPIRRGADAEGYRAEPYVIPANTDGPASPRFGRGGWTWYTGSAAWLHRAMHQWILGVRPSFAGLTVQPAIPDHWPGFEVQRDFRGGRYLIKVRRGAERALRLNGEERDPDLAFVGEAGDNEVELTLPEVTR